MIRRAIIAAAALLLAQHSFADPPETAHKTARDIFQQLIEMDTSPTGIGTTQAAQAVAQRLRGAGFADEDIHIVGSEQQKQNLVARLRGNGKKKPVLLIGHLDVVTALRSDWSTDPYRFIEKDGYFYGRGTQDMKDGIAVMVTTLMRYKQEGLRPDRDIILALTADEESGTANGVEWLLKNRRDLVDAEFVLNHDTSSVLLENGKATQVTVTASEKVYADFALVTRNAGGHSSLPVKDNAIYAMADALQRLARFEFPFEMNHVTRPYFERMLARADAVQAAELRAVLREPPDAAAVSRLSSRPIENALTHTTCVATRTEAGHANNALPQMARATVNCRILPGYSPEEVRQTLVDVIGNPAVNVSYINVDGSLADVAPQAKGVAPPPLREDIMRPVERIAKKMWPDAKVVPFMTAGATDGVHTSAAGLPTYLVSGLALDRNDLRAHGRDERVPVTSFYRSVDFYYEFLRAVASYK
jgi:acetylornithine deacetylase/succinyl-diaminopimelate desuccinylase-like protein